MNALKATVPNEALPEEELVELGPDDEAELERALSEAEEAERNGTLVPWKTYFAARSRHSG